MVPLGLSKMILGSAHSERLVEEEKLGQAMLLCQNGKCRKAPKSLQKDEYESLVVFYVLRASPTICPLYSGRSQGCTKLQDVVPWDFNSIMVFSSKDALVTHVQPSQPRLSMKRLSELHTTVDSERSGTAQKEQTGQIHGMIAFHPDHQAAETSVSPQVAPQSASNRGAHGLTRRTTACTAIGAGGLFEVRVVANPNPTTHRQRNTFCSSFLSWSCNQNKAKEGCTDPDVCDQPRCQPLHPSWRFEQPVLKADCGMVQLPDLGSGCSRAAFMPQPLVPAWAMLQLCLHRISSPWSCP
ncbi:hypothetical protein Anapl_09193 [Anas platyrhynchos]|uniref:Uncharacterized protein n=1 Tax=Anas platyrhynchos TaxID=8839 RepID=R0KZC3_ANAPL|nr:hypothetical protein Anapl_09193 [Anas platyrhynchos]